MKKSTLNTVPENPATEQERKRPGRRAGDGRGRLGGRAKGTSNRQPQPLCDWILNVIDKNRTKIESQLAAPWSDASAILLAALIVSGAIYEARKDPEASQTDKGATCG